MRGVGKIRTRFKKKWRGYAVGTVINPPGALRTLLLKQDIVEIVPEVPAVEAPKSWQTMNEAEAQAAGIPVEPKEEKHTRRRRKESDE